MAGAGGAAVGRGGALVAVTAATVGAVVGGALVGDAARVGGASVGRMVGWTVAAGGAMAMAALTVAVGLAVALCLPMPDRPVQTEHTSHSATSPPQPTASLPRRPLSHRPPMRAVESRRRCMVVPPNADPPRRGWVRLAATGRVGSSDYSIPVASLTTCYNGEPSASLRPRNEAYDGVIAHGGWGCSCASADTHRRTCAASRASGRPRTSRRTAGRSSRPARPGRDVDLRAWRQAAVPSASR